MVGGIAFLYPLKLKQFAAKAAEATGILLIIASAILLNGSDIWPGILTTAPVLGAWLIITAGQQHSLLTNNLILQRTGSWSYSIYLWHWPVFVMMNHLDMNSTGWILAGIILSILLGYASYALIEQKVRFSRSASGIKLATHPTAVITLVAISTGLLIQNSTGYPDRFPPKIRDTFLAVEASPYRETCHSRKQEPVSPENACTYFGENITWAVLGDSHAIELSYALAETLKDDNEGVRHYSSSGCIPSYKQPDNFSKCSEWTNAAVQDLISRDNINSVLINFRYARALYGENTDTQSGISDEKSDKERTAMLWSLNQMIQDIAAAKQHVFVMLPIPELTERIPNILAKNYKHGQEEFTDIPGKDLSYFLSRNQITLDFFRNTDFPENVILIDPIKHFCDEKTCYALRNGTPLYFDDDHPSLEGARKMLTPLSDKTRNKQATSAPEKS